MFFIHSQCLSDEFAQNLVAHPVGLAYDLVQQFAQMLRNRTGELLDPWLAQVQAAIFPNSSPFPLE